MTIAQGTKLEVAQVLLPVLCNFNSTAMSGSATLGGR